MGQMFLILLKAVEQQSHLETHLTSYVPYFSLPSTLLTAPPRPILADFPQPSDLLQQFVIFIISAFVDLVLSGDHPCCSIKL